MWSRVSLSKNGLNHINLSLQFSFDYIHNTFQHYFTCMADQLNSYVIGALLYDHIDEVGPTVRIRSSGNFPVYHIFTISLCSKDIPKSTLSLIMSADISSHPVALPFVANYTHIYSVLLLTSTFLSPIIISSSPASLLPVPCYRYRS